MAVVALYCGVGVGASVSADIVNESAAADAKDQEDAIIRNIAHSPSISDDHVDGVIVHGWYSTTNQ